MNINGDGAGKGRVVTCPKKEERSPGKKTFGIKTRAR